MKKALSLVLVLVMLLGMMPMTAFATEGTQEAEAVEVVTEPTEAPEEETTAPAEETEPSDEEEETEPSGEEEETEPSEPSKPEEETEIIHTHDYVAVITAPTCTENGYTTYTCACGDSYLDDYVDATGHTPVTDPGVKPTSESAGLTEGSHCSACGTVLTAQQEIPARGCDWMLEDGEFKILLIGNSFSEDASNCGSGMTTSQMLDIFQAMLGDDVKVTVGLCASGGKGLNWHATQSELDNRSYSFRVISTESGVWKSIGSSTSANALAWTDWDVVSLQHYEINTDTGKESNAYPDQVDPKFDNLEAASEFMLDHVYLHAPNADVYFYMHWARAYHPRLNESLATYNKMAAFFPVVLDYRGTETGQRFNSIIPVGLSVQNARTTYLATLAYNTTAYADKNLNLYTDAQIGLQRDGGHLSYNIGRYIAALTFAETVIPQQLRAEGYVLPEIRVTESVGKLPSEYSEIAQKAVHAAVDSWSQGSLAVTEIAGYTEDPTAEAAKMVEALSPGLTCGDPDTLSEQLRSAVLEALPADFAVDTIVINDETNTAAITIRFGYTSITVDVAYAIVSHTYENGICTGCGTVAQSCIWQITDNGAVIGAYADLQNAVDACEAGNTVTLTENCSVATGASIQKSITIDGGNHLVDISGCSNAFITVAEGAQVILRDLQLDGGATGFQVDYDAVTYTNYTIPLVPGSLDNDPKASQSAIISSGSLICENVDISNRYTASVGGAMQILSGSVSLTECDFVHNYGTSKGGALFIGSHFSARTEYPVKQVTITGCSFTENYSGHGGAIYAYNVEKIDISDSEFISNTANGGKGGAIDLFSETTQPTTAMNLGLDFIQTTIRSCTFRGNWAGNDGFAIQSYDSDLYIYSSEFIENVGVHPTSSVGTISTEAYRHADESYRIYTLLDGCLFERNQGPCAVYGDHSSISDLDVFNCVSRNNVGNNSFLLYSATSHLEQCRFIDETMTTGVIDARIYENYTVPPRLTLTDTTFTDCNAPAQILTRKQNHNPELNTYQVILEGTTNGNITIWDNNAVTILGSHTGNIQLGYNSERTSLTVGSSGTVNGIIFVQPVDGEAKLGERYMVEVLAEGEGLKYQWYFRNAGSSSWFKSSVKDNTYDDVMTAARAGREVYCVITDVAGNTVTTDTAKLVCLPCEELKIVTQPTDSEAVLGERYCVTVEAQGDGLKYQWYFRNAGSTIWYKSGVKDNTYDDVMTAARAGREVYCVITDVAGNTVTTETATLIRIPKKLEITAQPENAQAAFGEPFCATVEASGEGLKYQWYFRNAGSTIWYKSGVKDNTYDDIMTKARNGRQIYCVITDMWGNSVTTDTVQLIAVPKVELKVLSTGYESAAMGEMYCATVHAQGEGLTYQWYFRNAGSNVWYKSGVRDNTYDDVMTKARANRDVYCIISDAYGNWIKTEVITLELSE